MDYKNYKIIKNRKELTRLIKYCKKTGYASVDFETNAEPFHAYSSYPTMLGVSFQVGSGWIIPLAHFDSCFLKDDEWIDVLKEFGREIIENMDIVKIAHNLKFEDTWFKKYGIQMKGRLFDTMLAKYLLDEERPHDLKSIVAKFLPEYGGYEEYEGSNLPWAEKPLEGLAQYCAMDCDLTFRMWVFFEPLLIKHKFYSLFRNMMMMGSRVLAESEFTGMHIDIPYLDKIIESKGAEIDVVLATLKSSKPVQRFNKSAIKKRKQEAIEGLQDEIKGIRNEIDQALQDYGEKEQDKFFKFKNRKLRTIQGREDKISKYLAGEFTTKKEQDIIADINFASVNQMRDLLFISKSGFRFKVVKYTVDKKTKKESDKASTDGDVLEELAQIDKTGFIKALLSYRGETKLYGTYMVGMKAKVGDDGAVHGRFLLHGTVTGRLSSREPNLQNIPRDTTSSEIKQMFVPPKGKLIMQLDYSQAELRVLAAQADETTMLEWFNSGKDIHLATACKKYDWDYDERKAILKDSNHEDYVETKVGRKQAKTINFGIVYGQGPKLLAVTLSDHENNIIVTPEGAKQFLLDFDILFPKIAEHIARQHKLVKRDAFVTNVFGRKRRLPNIDSPKFMESSEAQRQSVNAPIQGAASDFTLFSSILIRDHKLRGLLPKSLHQCATVHDSLIFYIEPKYLKEIIPKLYKICRNPLTMKWFGFQIDTVEMSVDFEVGDTWGNLKDYDPTKDYEKLL